MKDLCTATALFYCLLITTSDSLASCPNVPVYDGATNSASIITQAGCTIGSGTYVKKGTTIKIHGLATVGGSCQLWAINIQRNPPACEQYGTDVNTVDHLTLWKDEVNTTWRSDWQGWPHHPTFDTHDIGTTGPISDTPDIGTHTYFHTSINNVSPNCPPTAPASVDSSPPIEVNVLKCQPQWSLDSHNNLARLPAGTVSIYLDPSSFAAAASALDAAMSAWNNQLTGTGSTRVTFQRVSSPCGTGGNCISVSAVDLFHKVPSSCGFSPPANTDSNGVITGAVAGGSLQLQIDVTWGSWSTASLERTFEHELGHYLGLGDYGSACDSTGDSAVMQDNFHCGASDNPSTAVSVNDYIPVNKTVYGGQTRNTCGY